jgi:hypothetical protein
MTEAQIQRAVMRHIEQRGAPGLFAFHAANGGYRKPVEAARLKGLGVKAGVPDIIAIHEGKVFVLELKTDTGRPTEAQLAAIDAINRAGGFARIANGLDAALRCLEAWKILRGKAS